MFLCSPRGTRQGEETPPKTSRIDFGVEVRLKALCFRHKQLLILPGEPGSRLARARARGVVDAVRLGGNDQKRTDALLPVLAPVHGYFACGDATSANPLETLDVVADVATGARARRFRGGSEARARRSRYVSRVLAGTRGRARVRGLLRARILRPQRRLRTLSMRSTPLAPSPEARVGRCVLWGAGDAKQPLKRRESARKARAAARETAMAVL